MVGYALQMDVHVGVSKNKGTPKSSILIGFSIIFTIHFGGKIPLFLVQHPYTKPLDVNLLVNSRFMVLEKMANRGIPFWVNEASCSIWIDWFVHCYFANCLIE